MTEPRSRWSVCRFLAGLLRRSPCERCPDILADLDEPHTFPSIVDLPRFDAWAARMQGVRK